MNQKLRSGFLVVASVGALTLMSWGVVRALHSPLFVLQSIQVNDLAPNLAISTSQVIELAQVPMGQKNLFDLDLKPIEARIRTHAWIQDVRLSKRFPRTLEISVSLRKPVAILSSSDLRYVDATGAVFGTVALDQAANLPVIQGVKAQDNLLIQRVLALLENWAQSPVHRQVELMSIDHHSEQGFRLWVTYRVADQNRLVRSRLYLGPMQGMANESAQQLSRIHQVFDHLTRHSAVARQIYADAGKKIVVKIAHGS